MQRLSKLRLILGVLWVCLFKVWIKESTVHGFGPLPAAKQGMWLSDRPRLISDQHLLERGLSGTREHGAGKCTPGGQCAVWQGLGTVPGFSEFYLNSQPYLWVRPFI